MANMWTCDMLAFNKRLKEVFVTGIRLVYGTQLSTMETENMYFPRTARCIMGFYSDKWSCQRRRPIIFALLSYPTLASRRSPVNGGLLELCLRRHDNLARLQQSSLDYTD